MIESADSAIYIYRIISLDTSNIPDCDFFWFRCSNTADTSSGALINIQTIP